MASTDGPIVGRERSDAVEADARRGDAVPGSTTVTSIAPAGCGLNCHSASACAVAQRGGRASGQDGGEPAPVRREVPVPDRIDATVNAVEAPVACARRDGLAGQTEIDKLRQRDDPVLTCRDRGPLSARCQALIY